MAESNVTLALLPRHYFSGLDDRLFIDMALELRWLFLSICLPSRHRAFSVVVLAVNPRTILNVLVQRVAISTQQQCSKPSYCML